jgi:hypothetical protein
LRCKNKCPLWAKSGHRHAYSVRPRQQERPLILICVKRISKSPCLVIGLGKTWFGEVLMLGFSHRIRFWAAIMTAAIMLTGTLSLAYAATGSVRFQIVKAGFIVGIGGGSGTLNFKGRNYRLGIGGINVGTIGASAVDLVGTASNLRTAADIVGTYTQGSAALAIVGGGRVATLQNANGVVIKVRGPAIGLEASLSLSGMTISMQ